MVSSLTKPLVLMEGKIDPIYLTKAIELIIGPDLLQKIDIKAIGEAQIEKSKGQGKDALKRAQNVLQDNPNLTTKKIMIIYDCDVEGVKESQSNNLKVYKLLKNPENEIFTSGVENLLPNNLSKQIKENSNLVKKKQIKIKLGEPVVELEEDKQKIAEFVFAQNNIEHLENFRNLINVLKEFIK